MQQLTLAFLTDRMQHFLRSARNRLLTNQLTKFSSFQLLLQIAVSIQLPSLHQASCCYPYTDIWTQMRVSTQVGCSATQFIVKKKKRQLGSVSRSVSLVNSLPDCLSINETVLEFVTILLYHYWIPKCNHLKKATITLLECIKYVLLGNSGHATNTIPQKDNQ